VPEWGIASSELAADPAVRFGRLDNGMRYAIRRNATPQGGASIRFTIDAGAREEATRSAARRISSSTWPSTDRPTFPKAS
jgi:predicted Zn-dependent peptidase